jgi:hypothetical protein
MRRRPGGRVLLGFAATGLALLLGAPGRRGIAAEAPKLEAELTATPSAAGIDLAGWAVDPCGDPEVVVEVDGRIVLRGEPSLPDPRVTERFRPLPGSAFPAFRGRLGTENLGEGRRRVRVVVHSARCGAEKVLLDSTYAVPAVWRRPVRAADLLASGAFLVVCLLLGWTLTRFPSRETSIPGMPRWVLASWVAAAAAIVAGPKMASSSMQLAPGFFSPLAGWDGGWYTLIATRGYDRLTSRAFFPLFPALLKAGQFVPIPLPLFGALLVLLFSWLAVRLLACLEPRRDLAVLFLFSVPASFFLSAVYTEALFLALAAGLLVALAKESAPWAFAASLLASLTRPQGVFLALFSAARLGGLSRRAALAGVAGSALGFGGWCAWLWYRVGDPLAFRTATAWFGRSSSFSLTALVDATEVAIRSGNAEPVFSIVSLVVVLAASAGLILERRLPEGLFSILVPVLSLATNSPTSIGRYALGAFPALLYIGGKLRPGPATWALLGLLAAVKLVCAWFFGRGFFLG